MTNIKDIRLKYWGKIEPLDLELLTATAIKKSREFVLAHPEYKIPAARQLKLETFIRRRIKHEPIAYILGKKEFFGLDFAVNKHTLIPRPETELLVERAIQELTTDHQLPTTVLDIGTGSGNIIISIVKTLAVHKFWVAGCRFYGIDISGKALIVAKQNAKLYKVNKAIKFLRGNLLEPILKNTKYQIPNTKYLVVANLPYLSKSIYAAVIRDIKKYEPRSALLSEKNGLAHYEKLLRQIQKLSVIGCRLSVFMEISPEQKSAVGKLIKNVFPQSRVYFRKDLAGKWRVLEAKI